MSRRWRDTLLPRSLFGRVALILFLGLAVAHLFSFGLVIYERMQTSRAMMIAYVAQDVATSVAMLERMPMAERPGWVDRLNRPNYRYTLTDMPAAAPSDNAFAQSLASALGNALGTRYSPIVVPQTGAKDPLQLRVGLKLSDGMPLAVDLLPPAMAISLWVPAILIAQLGVLAAFTWLAVRIATRPLSQLAHAADSLGPDLRAEPLPEDGPTEVARASTAFNAMRQRIADHLAERIQILAAISHDLQTPLTRMQLRIDLLDNNQLTAKLRDDLDMMQTLVKEGLAYARTAQETTEPAQATDLHALLDSLVCDYTDAGRPVRLTGHFAQPITTRPMALRRIVTNLTDNALNFAGAVEIAAEAEAPDRVVIAVRDRGPGIPADELTSVLQPFYRLEGSRNRETGGAGLGLAIAQQLAQTLSGTLTLSNRQGGGLEARLSLPLAA